MKKSFLKEVASKYPSRFKMKHDGDSYLLYEGGPRSTKYDDKEAFEDYVEVNEGEADADTGFQIDLRSDEKTKKTTDDSNGNPDRSAWDKKVLSSLRETLYDQETGKDLFLGKIKPTVKEVVETARLLDDATVRNQLIQMLHADPVWLQDAQGLIRQWLGWNA